LEEKLFFGLATDTFGGIGLDRFFYASISGLLCQQGRFVQYRFKTINISLIEGVGKVGIDVTIFWAIDG
jgi:hypothetical protein